MAHDTRTIKTAGELETLREAGRRLGAALDAVVRAVRPGITTGALDLVAREEIEKAGDEPSFLNYMPAGARRAFPATLCVSVNDEVVHGIPGPRMLEAGDIVGLDLGLWHKGLCVDSAVTVPVGEIDEKAKKLIAATEEALMRGIAAAQAGARIGDISAAIEACALPGGYGIVRELGGHGVGYEVHETPYIPNFGKAGQGPVLKPGMVLAIEPMFNEGTGDVSLAADEFTFLSKDGGRSAHFEHTIIVQEGRPEIITKKA